jgi:hypothetical protein
MESETLKSLTLELVRRAIRLNKTVTRYSLHQQLDRPNASLNSESNRRGSLFVSFVRVLVALFFEIRRQNAADTA